MIGELLKYLFLNFILLIFSKKYFTVVKTFYKNNNLAKNK